MVVMMAEALAANTAHGASTAATDSEIRVELALSQLARREAATREFELIAEIEDRKLYRAGSHATVYGYLRANHGWSDGECRRRVTTARASREHPEILDTLRDGSLPLAHAEILARHVLNTTVTERPTFDAELGYWLNEARREYDDYRQRISQWGVIIEPATADEVFDQQRERRYVRIWRGDDGAVNLVGTLDPITVGQMLESWSQMVDALFVSDWRDAEQIHGDDVTPNLLARTDPQRQANALVHLVRLGITHPDHQIGWDPGVLVVVDEHTFEAAMLRQRFGIDTAEQVPGWHPDDLPLPAQRQCRTPDGTALPPSVAAQAAISGWIRFVMVDSLGNPIQQSSKQRLFRGPIRDAMLTVGTRCTHPGCRRRIRACQADHRHEVSDGGETELSNIAPACPRHNLFKSSTGIRPVQDGRGHWYLVDGDGAVVI